MRLSLVCVSTAAIGDAPQSAMKLDETCRGYFAIVESAALNVALGRMALVASARLGA